MAGDGEEMVDPPAPARIWPETAGSGVAAPVGDGAARGWQGRRRAARPAQGGTAERRWWRGGTRAAGEAVRAALGDRASGAHCGPRRAGGEGSGVGHVARCDRPWAAARFVRGRPDVSGGAEGEN